MAAAAEQPMDRRGHAFVQAALNLWEDPVSAEILRAIILTAAQEPAALQRLRQLYSELVLAVVSHSLPDTERNLRASLISTQIVGMVMNRYIWQIGTIATLPAPPSPTSSPPPSSTTSPAPCRQASATTAGARADRPLRRIPPTVLRRAGAAPEWYGVRPGTTRRCCTGPDPCRLAEQQLI